MNFVGGQRDFWRGTFGAAGGGLVGSGDPAVFIIANRTSGTAPCGVFFEAVAIRFGASNPAHDLSFTWTFDDEGTYDALSAGHPHGMDRNRAFGPIAAHTFESAGTYQVTLDVSDGSLDLTATLSIDVADADTVFAGPATFAISRNQNFADAPAGSQQFATLAQAITAAKSETRRDVRFLLERGGIHDTRSLPSLSGTDFDALAIGAFGSGRKPILSRGLSITGPALSGELAVNDLLFRGNFDANRGGSNTETALLVSGAASTTVSGLEIIGYGTGIEFDAGLSNGTISNCQISNWANHGIRASGSDKVAILGSRVAQTPTAQPTAASGGPIHLTGEQRRALVWHCDLFSNAGGSDHAPCVAWNAASYGSASGMVGFSRLEGGHPVLQASPETSGVEAKFGYLLVDKSLVLGTANAGNRGLMTIGYGGTTVQNSIFVAPDVTAESGSDVPAFVTGGDGSTTPGNSASTITLRSNTFVDLRSTTTLANGSQVFAIRDAASTAHFTNWTEFDALNYAPNLATPVLPTGNVSTTALLPGRYMGVRTGPDLLDKSFATPDGTASLFAPKVDAVAPGDLALSGETLQDFFGHARSETSVLGAIEVTLPLDVEAQPSGDITIQGLSVGEATVHISGTGVQDGTTDVPVDGVNDLATFISPPYASGSMTEGSTLTATSGALWVDQSFGPQLTTWAWLRNGLVVNTDSTHVVDGADIAQGLSLRQIVTNAAGVTQQEVEVITVAPFVETKVQASTAYIYSPGPIYTGSTDKVLFFAKVRIPTLGGSQTLIRSQDGGWAGPRMHMRDFDQSLLVSAMSTDARFATFEASTYGFAPGDEVSVLVSTTLGGQAVWRIRNAAGVWAGSEQNVNGSPAGGRATIGSNQTFTPWTTAISRLAVWFGVAPDLDSAVVRSHFIDETTGDLVNPITSQSIYGDPAFDFYGDASSWNAGQHQGSLPDFTHTGGLYTNVS